MLSVLIIMSTGLYLSHDHCLYSAGVLLLFANLVRFISGKCWWHLITDLLQLLPCFCSFRSLRSAKQEEINQGIERAVCYYAKALLE